MICSAGGFKNNDELLKAFAGNPAIARLYRESSPINHLTADDPPILLEYGQLSPEKHGGIHGAEFGVEFKTQADAVGVAQCWLRVDKDEKFTGYPGGRAKFVETVFNSTGSMPAGSSAATRGCQAACRHARAENGKPELDAAARRERRSGTKGGIDVLFIERLHHQVLVPRGTRCLGSPLRSVACREFRHFRRLHAACAMAAAKRGTGEHSPQSRRPSDRHQQYRRTRFPGGHRAGRGCYDRRDSTPRTGHPRPPARNPTQSRIRNPSQPRGDPHNQSSYFPTARRRSYHLSRHRRQTASARWHLDGGNSQGLLPPYTQRLWTLPDAIQPTVESLLHKP